jgi:hypothetical protein
MTYLGLGITLLSDCTSKRGIVSHSLDYKSPHTANTVGITNKMETLMITAQGHERKVV